MLMQYKNAFCFILDVFLVVKFIIIYAKMICLLV